MSADEIAVLRIELKDIEPLIWRRVAVRAAANLQTLHRIIQAAMGWQDYHLWEFVVGDKIYGVPDPEDIGWGHEVHRAAGIALARLLADGVTVFDYTYDMGDNWEHRILVERVETAKPDTLYPRFLGGERRCPPEDCSGVSGYYEFIDTIAAPDKGKGSRHRKEALDWYGGPYEPDDMGEEEIRAALARIGARSRNRGRRRNPA